MNNCEIIKDFNDKYQLEVSEKGHNIAKLLSKAKKKNNVKDIINYEKQIQIGKDLEFLDKNCNVNNNLSKIDCEKFSEAIELWVDELKFWTNKWYIKPFISKKKMQKYNDFVDLLNKTKEKNCN